MSKRANDEESTQASKRAHDNNERRQKALEERNEIHAWLKAKAELSGSRGKIPAVQRPQWATNLAEIRERLKDKGYTTRRLYESGNVQIFLPEIEDFEAFTKMINAMSRAGKKQLSGYGKYLGLLELMSKATREPLVELVMELTQGIPMDLTVTGIPTECIQVARQLDRIAQRVSQAGNLIAKFKRLAEIREEHLKLGGQCVWPDDLDSFEDDYQTRPEIRLCEARLSGEEMKTARQFRILDLEIGSKWPSRLDDNVEVQALRARLLDEYIDRPQRRRLAKFAYHYAPDDEPYNPFYPVPLVVGPFQGDIECMPQHHVGILADDVCETRLGRMSFQSPAELTQDMKSRFEYAEQHGKSECLDAGDFTLFLYPDSDCESLLVCFRSEYQEWSHVLPLNTTILHAIGDRFLMPLQKPEKYPYVAQTLLAYLAGVIKDGSLEKSWVRSSKNLELCPLWEIGRQMDEEYAALYRFDQEKSDEGT